MCELLGMSANTPTDIRFSFAGLAPRGGRTGPHGDGFGVAFHEGPAARVFLDSGASADSEIARLLASHPIRSRIVLAHIRRANRGRVGLANTHPFVRELYGRHWTFAHNGQLTGVKRLPLGRFSPVGGTDSEHAFCWLLGEIEARCGGLPPRATLDALLARLCARLAGLGVFNMLLSDSRSLYAHTSTRLSWLTRRAPFGPARLEDGDLTADLAAETTPDDVVTIIATRPLTGDETWQALPQGLSVFRDGERIAPARQSARYSTPVDPNPPVPRPVSSRLSTSIHPA